MVAALAEAVLKRLSAWDEFSAVLTEEEEVLLKWAWAPFGHSLDSANFPERAIKKGPHGPF